MRNLILFNLKERGVKMVLMNIVCVVIFAFLKMVSNDIVSKFLFLYTNIIILKLNKNL